MTFLDDEEIKKTISLMKPGGALFEVRLLFAKTGRNASGYFRDADTLIHELRKQPLQGANIYITLNEPNEACYSRKQKDCFIAGEKTTSDNDVVSYNWLMIDLDPKRPSGISSSDNELQLAKDLGNKIFKHMKGLGFENPLMALSGNGVHLLYRVDFENNKENVELMKKSLKALDLLFSNDKIEVDLKNFNPSRICKLYGTMAQKGTNDPERPHRMAKIVTKDTEIKVSDRSCLQKLCEVIPKEPERSQRSSTYRGSYREFNLEEWLNKYNIRYTKYEDSDKTKYALEECPFDSNHKGKDACIFQGRDGVIGFHCFHNSCDGKTWQDVRRLYEPDAYDRKYEYQERMMYRSYNRDKPPEPVHIKPKKNEPVFFTAKDILTRPKQTEHIIRTGIKVFDQKYRGLRKHDVTILSGYTGGAKSTLLSEMILNAIDEGNHVACFSGELAEDDYFRWMFLQAAGKEYIEPTQYQNYYATPMKYRQMISEWMEGSFWLYNNKYGFNFGAIMEQLEKMVDTYKLDMLCIDNLMALDISALSREKYDAQSAFVWKIHELAQKKDIHIIIVCHPRKPNGLLGKYDISGTSDISNAVDNILFVYRVDQTFRNYYKQFFAKDWNGQGTNVWHCDKARFGSVDDSYNPLYYEIESKRLKNELAETRNYGWQKQITGSERRDETEFQDAGDGMEIAFN